MKRRLLLMLIATTLASGAAEQPSQPPNPAPPIFRFEADEFWLNLHHFLALVDRHGQAVLRFITGAYGMEWPVGGYPVHFSSFSNWAGAYSTKGNLLVVESRRRAARRAGTGNSVPRRDAPVGLGSGRVGSRILVAQCRVFLTTQGRR